MSESDTTQSPAAATDDPVADYEAPAVVWVEVMEDAGVYAACAKDPFEPLGPGCLAVPKAGGS